MARRTDFHRHYQHHPTRVCKLQQITMAIKWMSFLLVDAVKSLIILDHGQTQCRLQLTENSTHSITECATERYVPFLALQCAFFALLAYSSTLTGSVRRSKRSAFLLVLLVDLLDLSDLRLSVWRATAELSYAKTLALYLYTALVGVVMPMIYLENLRMLERPRGTLGRMLSRRRRRNRILSASVVVKAVKLAFEVSCMSLRCYLVYACSFGVVSLVFVPKALVFACVKACEGTPVKRVRYSQVLKIHQY